MKAIMVMFDTLNRRLLPPYGCDWTHAPNFERLARRTTTFDNCYAGSLPCMPARRELHTGRHNFLHRSWGPLEPFDDSMPQMLKQHGVYTHLVTDHYHYWEDGGATYHPRYSSYEFFRGQEGDAWKGYVAEPDIPANTLSGVTEVLKAEFWRQNWVNRAYLTDESDHPQTQTFDAGLHFIDVNKDQDDWFLQIEEFDPHEPFFTYENYKRYYENEYDGPHLDWPDYSRVTEPPAVVEHARREHAALMTMCDQSLGRVLDAMDEHELWDDTMLIVCTDHGFMLGEHGWWGKNIQPWYDETAHIPLFVWDPRSRQEGDRSDVLVQTIDLAPTLLDFFGIKPTPDMEGAPLATHLEGDNPRAGALFGIFGGHVCVTDGRYVYMRASVERANQPLVEHTLMPTHMRGFLKSEAIKQAQLSAPLRFSKDMPILKIPGSSGVTPWAFGTLLFDLHTDPEQTNPLIDDELERRMARLLRDRLVEVDAPPEQYLRLGLPETGPIDSRHLLARTQWAQVEQSQEPIPTAAEFGDAAYVVSIPIEELTERSAARLIIQSTVPALISEPLATRVRGLTLLQIAAIAPGILTATSLRSLAEQIFATNDK